MQFARRLPFPSDASSSSKRVFTGISNLSRGSNIWWRERSYAASVPSDTPKVKKVRKRVSKADRKAMVESFVNRYRVLNSGKFPSACDARKEVGGSYYVIREIVQELEYKSKFPSINTRSETPLSKKLAKENKSVTKVEEVSSKEIHKEAQAVAVDKLDTGDCSKHFEVKEEPQTSILVENTLSEEIGKPIGTSEGSERSATHSHLLKEDAEEVLQPSPGKFEDSMKEKIQAEGVLSKTEQHQQMPESEKFETDLPEKHINEELEKKSSMWGNLKSLADGIINIWRKL